MHLTMEPQVLLSIIAIVAGITIYTFIKSRHAERMMQLQLDIPLDNVHRSYFELKFGLLFMGIGVGVLMAFILDKIFLINASELYPAFIFLFGGLGLFISFFIIQKYRRNQQF